MSSSNYPITILSDSDIEDSFSFTNTPNYTLASPDYFLALPGATSPDPLEDLSKSTEGNVTALKPQTLKEAITITQRNYKNKGPATRSNLQPVSVTCHACGEKEHYRNQYPKANNSAHGRAYLLRDKNAHQDSNVVTGTFLLNQCLARVLFYSGADKSFVSISLASMLNIPPTTLDTTYDIKMADGNLVGTNTVIQGAALVAQTPYRLAPSKMQELSDHLQELADSPK
nr:reverse transcriptase domain-containing protein [Tanacetum cinerariifolium]